MKTITLLGNCQCEAVGKMLALCLPEKQWLIKYFSNNKVLGNMMSIPEIIQGVKESDILIYQPLGPQHGELHEANIKQIMPLDSLSFSYIFNSGGYSLCHAPAGKKNPYGIIFGEEIIIEILKTTDIVNVIQRYLEGDINFNLLSRFHVCLSEMAIREKNVSIKLCEFILNNYQEKKLFLTHNHPSTIFIYEICRQIQHLLNLPLKLENIDLNNENLAELPQQICPISPYDIEVHGYRFQYHSDWFIKGVQLIKVIKNNQNKKNENINP